MRLPTFKRFILYRINPYSPAMKRPIILLLLLLLLGHVRGQESGNRRGRDSVRIHFRQGEPSLDPSFHGNGDKLDAFTLRLEALLSDSTCRVRGIRMVSGASPEGSTALNKALSEQRAVHFWDYIRGRFSGRDIPVLSHAPGIDWERLILLTEADGGVPLRSEALDILRHTSEWITSGGAVPDERKHRLALLGGGRTWRYMEEHFFPELRTSMLELWYECVYPEERTDTVVVQRTDTMEVARTDTLVVLRTDTMTLAVPAPRARKPFHMAVKTNLLYAAVVIPNIGLEFHLGGGWSVAGNWMYTWLKNDSRYRYHRVCGGDLEVRHWLSLGRKPLTGHHVGLYGQLLTYDLEWGGKGYLGDRWSYGGGISYGYSAPIGRRLNLDFTLGIGYLGGEYYEYVPQNGLYVWRTTKNRRWFGPTKAEVSLVWLLGHGNFNVRKGKQTMDNAK
ncbi:uncharacterized protein DUF3575 [Bacteroides heparinolyticus]|uniref:Uncharacterized protein DUF3575 n=2 Tax=Prevotella heparinolytica TaxID=28113 RepID=A0A4V2SEK4_9BACE|nr:uncharacterized protein DUF3575 [Bacteroides heparinolyticus]